MIYRVLAALSLGWAARRFPLGLPLPADRPGGVRAVVELPTSHRVTHPGRRADPRSRRLERGPGRRRAVHHRGGVGHPARAVGSEHRVSSRDRQPRGDQGSILEGGADKYARRGQARRRTPRRPLDDTQHRLVGRRSRRVVRPAAGDKENAAGGEQGRTRITTRIRFVCGKEDLPPVRYLRAYGGRPGDHETFDIGWRRTGAGPALSVRNRERLHHRGGRQDKLTSAILREAANALEIRYALTRASR